MGIPKKSFVFCKKTAFIFQNYRLIANIPTHFSSLALVLSDRMKYLKLFEIFCSIF